MSPRIKSLKFHVYDGAEWLGHGADYAPLIDPDLPVSKDPGKGVYDIRTLNGGPRHGEDHIVLLDGLNYIPAWWPVTASQSEGV